jgi:hypothetical protein
MMVDINMSRAFQQIGLTFVITDAVQCAACNEVKMRECRNYKELRAIDFSRDDLSA